MNLLKWKLFIQNTWLNFISFNFRVAAALVFDISRASTFQSVKRWLIDLREKVALPDGNKIPVILLANKSDIHQNVVTNDQITKFCKENEIDEWFITSAKENLNIGKNNFLYRMIKIY